MKLLILASLCLVLASAGRLENNYLPPNSAGSAAGSRFLSAPGRSSFSGSAFSGSQSFSSSSGQQIPIVKYNNDNNGDGQYRYSFETANHISAQEAGQAGDSSAVQGSYSYTGDDGQTYTINYVADENGYRPEGAHLPVAPPIPEEILKSLQQNAADEARGIVDDGSYNAAAHGGGSYSESGGSGYLSGVASNRGNFGSRSSGFSQQQQGGYKY